MPTYEVTQGPLKFKQGETLQLSEETASFRGDLLHEISPNTYITLFDIDLIQGEQFSLDEAISPGVANQVEEITQKKKHSRKTEAEQAEPEA
jgi:hypothetical protein